jgi:DNA invertase Pin-like site-specific DNA recombinase
MIIGYARLSTMEQNLDLQRGALKRAGCEKIIEDTVSGGKVQRLGLERVHDALRSGDVLAVWRLDRLGRSLKYLIELMAELEAERIGFQSVTESIDTTTPGGKLVFHIFAALAEFERNVIRERAYAGFAAARARGRKGGRRKKLGTWNRARIKLQFFELNTALLAAGRMYPSGCARATAQRVWQEDYVVA